MEFLYVCNLLEPYVRDVKAEELIEVDKLIEFDPYMRVGTRFLQRLYQEDKQNQSLTEDLLMEFADYYPDRARTFENILFDQRRYVNSIQLIIVMWKKRDSS